MNRTGLRCCCLAGLLLALRSDLCRAGCIPRPAEAAPAAELRIVSEPSGAEVSVDRAPRGPSPLSVPGLAPGRHLVVLTLPGHREWIGTAVLEAGQRQELKAALEPLRGAALVLSEPPGAQVALDGALYGTTPLLLPGLAMGTYRVLLTSPGYQDCPLDLEVRNATPQRLSAKLLTDSATLRVESDPPGAALSVNGVPRGATPAVLERIPDGDSAIELALAGYAPYRQALRLSAGDEETVRVVLQPLPASLQVHSIPAGARVYIDNAYRGETPLTLEDLTPGTVRVRVELAAHELMARDVLLQRGARQVEEFRLTANCGALRVVTAPAGVTVLVDGKVAGTTTARLDATDQISDPLTIPLVPVGDREVTFTRQGYAEVKRTVTVARGRTETLDVTLRRRFIPDYELRTASNVYRGVLVNITPEFVRLETEVGVIRAFPLADIKSRRPLREDERAELAPPPEE